MLAARIIEDKDKLLPTLNDIGVLISYADSLHRLRIGAINEEMFV